ncbi:MAG: DNA cytosine methyltransferase [Hyphomicrobiaceae bacterium]
MTLKTLELCAGAGGQALGLARAGFRHVALIDNDEHACQTLTLNMPGARVIRADIRKLRNLKRFRGIDLLAAGLPCPPFSVAGQQLGDADDRNLFPAMFNIVKATRPKAVMIENVPGLLAPKFDDYRQQLCDRFDALGYHTDMRLIDANRFGVPQRRQRVIIVALRHRYADRFHWPKSVDQSAQTVGEALYDLMAAKGWPGVVAWAENANDVAPTIVGGSKKHGGADLGPSRTRAAWAKLGVEGKSLADEAPDKAFTGLPRLTLDMVARLQGFPDAWQFAGRKTHAYRQIGNALPPAVARAVALQIKKAIAPQHRIDVARRQAPRHVVGAPA